MLLVSLFSRKPLSVSNFYKKELQKFVDKKLEHDQIDAVICYCSSMAEYIFRTPLYKAKKLDKVKLIMDYVDLDSDKWHQYSKYTKFYLSWIFKLEKKRLFEYEKRINREFDHSVFVAQREVEIFNRQYTGAQNIKVIPNGVSLEYFYPQPVLKSQVSQTTDSHDGLSLVFTGVMDYFANEDGVIWFSRKIFPAIKKEIPEVKFYIVGKRPTRQVKKLGNIEGVIVTDFVDNIRNYYWMADICVIPLRIARGLQNKVLEAMACGKPVVATKNASDGITCSNHKDIVIADNESIFAEEVIQLLRNKELRTAIGENAVKNIKSNYLWSNKIELFEDLLASPRKINTDLP